MDNAEVNAQGEELELDYDFEIEPIPDTENAAAVTKQDVGSSSSRAGALETSVKKYPKILKQLDDEGSEFWTDNVVNDHDDDDDCGVPDLEILRDLSVDSTHTRASVFLVGIRGLPDFDVLRIFAGFRVTNMVPVGQDSAVVQFPTSSYALKMFINMTARLRFHESSNGMRPHEEGEVESDDDEGEITKEDGKETIYLIDDESIISEKDEVRIDSARYSIPKGEWRAVVKHVPGKKILLIRYATAEEVEAAGLSITRRESRETTHTDSSGLSYKWNSGDEKVRPGLNIFDSKGRELDWDYEHDTRFYEETPSKKDEKEAREAAKQSFKGAVKVRGRGAKRFLDTDAKTLSSDSEIVRTKKVRQDDEEDWTADPSTEPSDQPWDKKSRLSGRIQRD